MKGQPRDTQLVLQKKERKDKCLRNFYSQTMQKLQLASLKQ